MAKHDYERLSAQDFSLLVFEKPNVHMHVTSTQIFEAGPLRKPDGGINIEMFRRAIDGVLPPDSPLPATADVTPIENRPVWVDDSHFTSTTTSAIRRFRGPGGGHGVWKQLVARVKGASNWTEPGAMGDVGRRVGCRGTASQPQQGASLHAGTASRASIWRTSCSREAGLRNPGGPPLRSPSSTLPTRTPQRRGDAPAEPSIPVARGVTHFRATPPNRCTTAHPCASNTRTARIRHRTGVADSHQRCNR